MAKIRTLKDKHLVGGMCDTQMYPETSTSAVYSTDKNCNPIDGVEYVLEDRLQDIESDIETLNLKVDDLKISTNNCGCESLSESEVTEILGTEGTSKDSCKECDCESLTDNDIQNILND